MTRGTREHHEMLDQFERDIQASNIYTTDLTRADKNANAPSSVFYDNGKTNELFTAYMLGYAYAKGRLQ